MAMAGLVACFVLYSSLGEFLFLFLAAFFPPELVVGGETGAGAGGCVRANGRAA